jgi:hypothetical protein
MKGTRIEYSKEELAWISRSRSLPRARIRELFCARFKREDISIDNIRSLCNRRGWKSGRNGCFPKGHVPANKGKKMPFNENCARTQFKPGHVPKNAKYLGHERLSKDGYIEISVAERNPHTGYDRRYVPKHKYLWEKKNGPIPKGMCLLALDGDRRNTDPSNWTLITRATLLILNQIEGMQYQAVDARLRPVMLAIAKLRAKRFELKRWEKKQVPNGQNQSLTQG